MISVRMTLNSYNNMNELVRKCFNANAIIDNLAYNLDFYYYNQIAEVVHHKVAHVMPVWADIVSDKMLELSARPIRKGIGEYTDDISDLKEIFKILVETFYDIREFTRNLIESADMNGDDEVRIFGEEFLVIVSPFIKQAEEWINASNKMSENDLNIHIEQYTHFLTK